MEVVLLELVKALPYMVGILTAIIADRHWLYSELKADKKEYEEKYQAKEAEVEKLKDQINQLKIKIIKLETKNETRY
jgi:phage shock protein A